MRGIGRASGAISFVNALLEGHGCAASVTLPVEAEVEVEVADRGESGRIHLDSGCDTPLARAALLAGLRTYWPAAECTASLSVRSSVPPARGLKSSSAVPAAILRAVAQASGRSSGPILEEAQRVQEIGLATGTSSTGAFDDALAALGGGICVTDNRESRVLLRANPDPAWRLLLWIPGTEHPPIPSMAESFREQAADGREAVRLALSGRFLEAMERNTLAVERALGISHAPLREELRRHGALASGVSGAGPTLAVIVPARQSRRVARALPRRDGTVVAAGFLEWAPGAEA